MVSRSPSYSKEAFNARHVFTDRDTHREAFSNALGNPQTSSDVRVLNFHGVGGQGKTALCEQFTITLAKEKIQNRQLGWATLDFDVSEYCSSASALLAMRLQLAERCKIAFPAFDTAFARYFAFARQVYNIHNVHPDLFKQPNNVLQDIEDVIGDIFDEVPGAGLFCKHLRKLSTVTQNWWRRRGKEVLKGLDSLDKHELLAALPTYLGADLCDWLFDENAKQSRDKRRLVILLDTYEALWRDQPTKTGLKAMRVDAWVRRLIQETPGILYVVLGRDQLNWGEIESEFEPYIASHLLGDLSRPDADKLLQQAPIEEADVRTAMIESAAGLPFYLDLQIDLYEDLKQQNPRPPAGEFGGKEQDILAGFTDHLDEDTRRALHIVSHAHFIDEGLAHQLVEAFLGGRANINFKQLTGYSFWKQQGNAWYLHALMRDYLQDRQRNDEPALFNNIHRYLFRLYDSKLESLKQVIDITETHKQALTEAGYHQQQYDATKFPDWACRRGQLFHDAYIWEQVAPLWERALEVAESLPEVSHLDTAVVLNNLAVLYTYQHKHAEAEPLYQRSQGIWEAALGKDHPHVATALNNLALLYRSQAEYTKAEPLYQRSLRIWEATLGKDHPKVATALHGLASLYRSQGEYAKAELLYQRSLRNWEATLTNWEATLGKDHPEFATALHGLASLYRSQGEYTEAEPFYQRAIIILEKLFPDGHPNLDTLKSNYADLKRQLSD